MKSAEEIMEILDAYDLTGSLRDAGELAGCSHHTVKHYVERRAAGGELDRSATRPQLIDEHLPKVEEWVERSHGKVRADVAHEKLIALGYKGSERTTRRAVAKVKKAYREWARTNRPVATRTIADAQVVNRVRDLAWRVDHEGVRRMTPEGLYGRRKMTALVQRTSPDASPGSVDRAMRTLSLQGVRRSKGIRSTIPAKDGKRAGDLLDRNFTALAPNRTWVMDFTYVRTWAGFVYVAFILDVFAQKIVARNLAPTKAVELVDVLLRMALWQRDREGHSVVPGELIGHADAGSQYTSITFTEHLADEGIRPSSARLQTPSTTRSWRH